MESDELKKVAYVNSQIVCAIVELEAMRTENNMRDYLGQMPAYDEKDFIRLIDKYQLGHNSVISNLHQ